MQIPFLHNVHFLHPWFLLLLGLLPLLIWWYIKKANGRHSVMTFSHVAPLLKRTSWRVKLRYLLPFLKALSFVCLVLALARPQKHLKEEKIEAKGVDIMLAMDVSTSMLARDFEPDRMEASKKVAIDFVDKRPYDRIGLSIFSGEAFGQTPLTTDHEIVKGMISGLKTGILADGTAIGMGLSSAVNRLKDSKAKSKIIILLTDGVNNTGYIDPVDAGDIAAEYGIKVYTIGVGTNGQAPFPIRYDRNHQLVYGYRQVEIDEDLLKQISKKTGGEYFRANNMQRLALIYDRINELEKTKIDVTVIRRQSEMFFFLALLALIFMGLEVILRYSILRTLP